MTTAQPGPVDDFSDLERETLRCVLRHMIPASAELGVPGADDPLIFADILRSIQRDRWRVGEALRVIDALCGGGLAGLADSDQEKCLSEFRTRHPDLSGILESAAARCYYRDDRVMASIGMEARPPFPLGYEVDQGDWSLLDPVRARGRIYRDAS